MYSLKIGGMTAFSFFCKRHSLHEHDSISIRYFLGCFVGEYDSREHWAYCYVRDTKECHSSSLTAFADEMEAKGFVEFISTGYAAQVFVFIPLDKAAGEEVVW